MYETYIRHNVAHFPRVNHAILQTTTSAL